MKNLILFSLLFSLTTFYASARLFSVRTTLNGANVVPANATTATGTLTGTFDDVTGVLNYSISYSGFIAADEGHFRLAAPGANGPKIFSFLTPFQQSEPPALIQLNGTVTFTAPNISNLLIGNVYLELDGLSTKIRGQITIGMEIFNSAARTTFYGIGGYSFSQGSFPNGVQANSYVVSGPSPQNDFSYAVSAVGGITNRADYISTTNTNTGITIRLFGNNVRKFGCRVLSLNLAETSGTNNIISLTARTNLGNTATQTGGFNIGQFVGFNVTGDENEYIVSISATFQNPPSPAAYLTIHEIIVGDNTPQNVALNFDGVNDYVSLPNTVGNFDSGSNFTVSCWFKPDPTATHEQNLVNKWNGSGGYAFTLRYYGSTGTILAGQYDGFNFPRVESSTNLKDGKWHHVLFTKNASDLVLYIDGGFVGKVTDNATGITTNNTPLNIGREATGTNYFKGEIDEVRIWTQAKIQIQVTLEMFCKNPERGDLQAAYNFSNGVPHGNNEFITQVQDLIGYHGTLNNFARSGDASNFVTGQVKYVKGGFIDSHGSSWANAFINLQTALAANSCNDLFDVYVAGSSVAFKPSLTGDVNASFNILSGMRIYGGFAGNEKSINQRNKASIQTTNETTLSGDLSANDLLSNFTQNRTDNSRTVVNVDGKSNIILDGFSIKGGFGGSAGGGINALNSDNIKINNCKIFDNSASNGGGINANTAKNLLISNTYLLGNRATIDGHALYFISTTTPINMKLNNTIVAGHIGDAITAFSTNTTIDHSYTNCTFANNIAAIRNSIATTTSTNNFSLKNSIIYGNITGIGVNNLDGTYNPNITYSLVQGVSTGIGNLNGNTTNPQFVILPVPAVSPSTGGDFRLKNSSPCINTGDDAGVSPLDLDRNPRPRGGKTDMGAFESNINLNEIISIATGNWENTTSWNLERLPLPTDKVILNGHQITVTSPNAQAKTVDLKTSSSNLLINNGAKLTVQE